jgi:asparagine synthase (glutamine-hydrolysing)
MSAIAAIFHLDRRPAINEEINSMLDRLVHRGHDNCGSWVGGSVGLGHRMACVTPESLLEELPTKSSHSNAVITCDARLDNREELIRHLKLSFKPPAEVTDSEIVLNAFEKWGEGSPARLIGDFVFAIWNPSAKKLFCARDPLGVKHFYYYHRPRELLVLASEIKAVLAIQKVPQSLDKEHLGNYLALNFDDQESTFYSGIKRLPATCAMTISEDGFRVWRYWSPDPTKEISLPTPREYHDAFREKFADAVTSRLRSVFPVGSQLSGGLDSSSISCVASQELAKLRKPPLNSFSAVFPTVAKTHKRIDELSFMESVITHAGCHAQLVNCDDASPIKEMNKMTWHIDQPVGVPNIYIDWRIFEAAAEKDIRVMLSGVDGDSTVSHGYEDFAGLMERGKFIRMIREAKSLKRNMPGRHHSYKSLLWTNGLRTVPFFGQTWNKINSIRNGDAQVEPRAEFKVLNPVFNKEFGIEQKVRESQLRNSAKRSSRIEEHWLGLSGGLMSFLLETYEKTSQAFSIEQRYPFFDRRLIEFCISLPPGQRIYDGWTRSIFRHAMEGILPKNVQWRTDKAKLSAGVRLNFLKFGTNQLDESLEQNFEVIDEFVDVGYLRVLFNEHKQNPLRPGVANILLMNVVYLSTWLRSSGIAR